MEQIDKYTLYGTRLLVFLEESPQSNKYRQVCLDAKTFKAVSDAICGGPVPEGKDEEECEIIMSTDVYDLFDLPEIYES